MQRSFLYLCGSIATTSLLLTQLVIAAPANGYSSNYQKHSPSYHGSRCHPGFSKGAFNRFGHAHPYHRQARFERSSYYEPYRYYHDAGYYHFGSYRHSVPFLAVPVFGAEVSWVSASDGMVPADAVYQSTGFVCRAFYRERLYNGRVWGSGCRIFKRGLPFIVNSYDVMVR